MLRAVGQRHRAQRFALGGGPRLGRLPYLLEKACDGLGRAGHAIDQRVIGVVPIAMQPRLLVAQGEDLAGDRPVVVFAVVLAAAGPGGECLLAQVAAVGEREERHDERTRQRDDPDVGLAAFLRRCARGGPQILRQAGEIALVPQDQTVAGFVGQNVLAEAGREFGKALHDRAVAHSCRGGKPGAFAHEIQMGPLDEAQLLRREPQLVPPLVQLVDAREEPDVQADCAVMGGEPRRDLAFDGLQRRRGLRGGQIEEQSRDAPEVPAAAVERCDGVVERRRLAALRNGVRLGAVHLHRVLERRAVMLGPDLCERRQAERRLPRMQQRVGGLFGHGQRVRQRGGALSPQRDRFTPYPCAFTPISRGGSVG